MWEVLESFLSVNLTLFYNEIRSARNREIMYGRVGASVDGRSILRTSDVRAGTVDGVGVVVFPPCLQCWSERLVSAGCCACPWRCLYVCI